MMVDDTLWNMNMYTVYVYMYICIPLLDRNVGLEQRTILKCFQALLILKLGKMPKWWFRVNSECHGQYWNHHHLVDKPSPPGRTRTMQWPRLQMPWMPPVQGLRIFPKNHVMILGSRVGVWKGRRSVTTDDWRPITLICWKKTGLSGISIRFVQHRNIHHFFATILQIVDVHCHVRLRVHGTSDHKWVSRLDPYETMIQYVCVLKGSRLSAEFAGRPSFNPTRLFQFVFLPLLLIRLDPTTSTSWYAAYFQTGVLAILINVQQKFHVSQLVGSCPSRVSCFNPFHDSNPYLPMHRR